MSLRRNRAARQHSPSRPPRRMTIRPVASVILCLLMYWPIVAFGQSAGLDAPKRRLPDPSCVFGAYTTFDSAEAAAKRGVPAAIFCSALFNAFTYNNDTINASVRRQARKDALMWRAKAEALGFEFNRYILIGATFDGHLAQGDADFSGFTAAPRPPKENWHACQARLGAQCMGQCGGNGNCYSMCMGGSSWQCNR